MLMLGWIGQQIAAPFKGLLNLANPLPNNVQQITPDLVRGFFEPGPANMVGDKILSTVYSPPYSGPGDLDRDQCETPVIRAQYNAMYRQEPSIRSAIRGKVDAISCQEVSVQPFDKTKPIDRLAADFCKWAVEETDHGWDGLFDLMLTPAFINGVSYAEKSLEPKEWPQQHELRTDYVWGLKQVRSLDPYWIRLQLDVFWNVTAVVNLVRGLQYYSPDNVLLYTHNHLYHNPFGQSDIRACYRAANIIQDAYQAWYIATKVYGEPYMVAKTKKDRIAILNTVMQALRGSGYAVIDKDDEIEAINLAAATGTSAFGELIKTLREDVFLAVRGAYTPFLEGQGGSGAHNDTEVSEDQANTTELASIKRSCRVIRRQLFPWLVGPNFPKGTGLPFLRLGGTDNEKSLKWVQLVKGAQEAGAKVDADWFYETTGIVAAEPGKELAPPQPPADPAGQGGPPGDPPEPPQVGDGSTAGIPPKPQPPAPTQTMSDTAKSTFVARLAAHLVDRAKPGKADKEFADDPARDDHGQFAPKGIHGVHAEWKAASGPAKEALHDAIYNTIGDDPGAKPHRGKVDAARLARRVASSWASLRDDHPGESAPLERAARHAGVEFRGTVGETVPFDPSHHGSESGISTGTPVRIVRPAAVHPDATGGRVLVQAKVEPAGKTFADWEEGKHPRADDGKFGKGDGGIAKESTSDDLHPRIKEKYERRLKRTPPELHHELTEQARSESDRIKEVGRKLRETAVKDPRTGAPIIVFHGTDQDFDQFSNRPTFFSPSPNYSFVRDSDNIHAAYLDMRRPYYTDNQREAEAATYAGGGEFVKELKAKGYDGLIYSKPGDITKGATGWGDDHPQMIAFDAAQIIPVSKYDRSEFDARVGSGDFDPSGVVQQEALSDHPDLLARNKKAETFSDDDEMRSEYDLSQLKGGVRGKYANRFIDPHQAATLALLDYLIECKEDGTEPAAGLDRFAELGADESELTAAMGDDAETFADVSSEKRDESGKWTSGGSSVVTDFSPAGISEINKIIRKGDHRHYGLRVITDNPKTGEFDTPEVGHVLPKSYHWEDDNSTGRKMGGTSTFRIPGRLTPKDAERFISAYGTNGYHVVLVGSDKAKHGQDRGEAVMKDPVVLKVWNSVNSKQWEDNQNKEKTFADYDESKHPRDDHGRYVSRDAIHDAKSDPKKAAELRARVTKPEQREKLDKALAGHTDLGRTKRGQQRSEAATRRQAKEASAAKAKEILARIHTSGVDGVDLEELAAHLSALPVARLRLARQALMASWGGEKLRKSGMVDRILAHVRERGEAEKTDTRPERDAKVTGWKNAEMDFVPGKSLDENEVLDLVKKSPNLASKAGHDWERHAKRFGIEGGFTTGHASVEDLKKNLDSGHLRGSNSVDPDAVSDKAKSGKLNPVIISKEPGRGMVVVDGNHSLQAAIKRGDKDIPVIVSDRVKSDILGQKDAEKPKSAVAPKKPANTGKKKPKQEESFVSIIKRFGGIDPDSVRDHCGSLKEALEDGVPLGVFKKGGQNLDELAQELHTVGHLNVPGGDDPSQHLIDLLRDKTRRNLHTLTEHDYDKQYEDYYRQEHENALRTASESEVAEVVRSGEEAGRASGAEDPFGEGVDESGQDQRVDEVGEDDAGLDDSFDPSESDAPQRKTAAEHATTDYRDDLGEIEPGESGYVAGHFVRRGNDGSYQVETANGYVTGTADDINNRIRRNWGVQRADAGDVKRAMDRVENNPDPDPFFNPKGAESHAKGRAAVPHGTRAVSLDPNTHGRTGTVVRDDETGKAHLKLDNGAESKAMDFEPLDPQHSWREPVAKPVTAPKAEAKPLFGPDAGDDTSTAPKESTAAPDHYTSNGLPFRGAGQLAEDKLTAEHLPHIEKRLAGIDADIAGAHAAADKERDPFASAERRQRAEELEGLKVKLTAARGRLGRKDGMPSTAGGTGEEKLEYVRAAAGGQVSDVDGKHYLGGQLMPIHGKYSGMAKPPKGDGNGTGDGGPVKPNEDAEGGSRRRPAQPLSPDELEARKREIGNQRKWDEMRAGPLGKMGAWLGDKPNEKPMNGNTTPVDKWKEYVSSIGPEGVKRIVDTLEPEFHRAVDATTKAARDDLAKRKAEHGASVHDSPITDDTEEWVKNEPKRRAEEFIGMFRGKGHEKQFPGSHYAHQLIGEMKDKQNHPGINDGVERLHRLHALLSHATGDSERLKDYPDLHERHGKAPEPAPRPATDTPSVPGSDPHSTLTRDQMDRAAVAKTLKDQGTLTADEVVRHATNDGSKHVTAARAETVLTNRLGMTPEAAKALLSIIKPATTIKVGGKRQKPAYSVVDLYRAAGKLHEPGTTAKTPEPEKNNNSPDSASTAIDREQGKDNTTGVEPQPATPKPEGGKVEVKELPKLVAKSEKQAAFADETRKKLIGEAEKRLASIREVDPDEELSPAMKARGDQMEAGIEWLKENAVDASAWLDWAKHQYGWDIAAQAGLLAQGKAPPYDPQNPIAVFLRRAVAKKAEGVS
jgi:hypothetical protein